MYRFLKFKGFEDKVHRSTFQTSVTSKWFNRARERGEVTWLKPIDRIASLSSPLIHRSFRNLGIRGTVWSCVNVRPTGEPVKLALRGIRQINFDQVERHRTRAPIILLGGLNRLLFKTFLFLNIFSRYTATKLNGLLLEVNLWNGH